MAQSCVESAVAKCESTGAFLVLQVSKSIKFSAVEGDFLAKTKQNRRNNLTSLVFFAKDSRNVARFVVALLLFSFMRFPFTKSVCENERSTHRFYSERDFNT
jgi:hypothetical protein